MQTRNRSRLPSSQLTISADAAGAVSIGPWPIFSGTHEEFEDLLRSLMDHSDSHLIVTPNVDHVLRLQDDANFRSIYDAASLRLIDGAPISALASLALRRRVRRLAGSDLLENIGDFLGATPRTIAIVGGASAEIAATSLERRHKKHRFTAVDLPMVTSLGDARLYDVCKRLRAIEPDVVFVCIGSPKQELWYARWHQELPAAIFIGAGASADFSAGIKRRAPRLLQACGMEWSWRLLAEPRRMAHRYLIKGPRFLEIALRSAWASRRRADRG